MQGVSQQRPPCQPPLINKSEKLEKKGEFGEGGKKSDKRKSILHQPGAGLTYIKTRFPSIV